MAKYLWYSGATDVTGKAIAEALGITATKVRPRNLVAGDLTIGWGTKIDEDTRLTGTVWNSPNAIRANRDKLGALQKMLANRDMAATVAKFSAAGSVMRDLDRGTIVLPLIGRTKSHQSGKGFWLCPTKHLVKLAIDDGAGYFQQFIDIKDEYRLHVAFGEVILAVKKEENTSEESWAAIRKEKVAEYAEKNNVEMNDNTVNAVLKVMFKEAVIPDRIVRSNRRGWKFTQVQLNNIGAALKNAAIKAVEVLGLNFGAVDCAISMDNSPFIIEINSGPGLQGNALNKYVEMFTAKIRELERPVPVAHAAAPARAAAPRRAAGAVGAQEAAVVVKGEDNAMVMVMNQVRTPEEARRVLDLLMGR